MTINDGPAFSRLTVEDRLHQLGSTANANHWTSKTATAAHIDSNEIDYVRPMKVIVIGAGISGILASIRFPRRIPNLDLVVYDKNPEVGGTWYENKYPGVACGTSLLFS